MKRNWMIPTACIFLVMVVALLTVHLHKESRNEALSLFNEHQILHAQRLADQIESLFRGHSLKLKAVSSFGSSQDMMKQMSADIQAYSKQIGKDYIDVVSLYDETGTMISSTNIREIGLNCSLCEFFSWAKKKESKGRLFISPLFRVKEESQSKSNLKPNSAGNLLPYDSKVFLAMPLYQGSLDANNSKQRDKFVGVCSFIIDLKDFLAKELKDPKMGLHQVWIMDKEGELLFQSEHPEMVFRNIHRREGSCNPCHTSFDYIERILKEEQGTIDYTAWDGPRKLAAFAPMKFENASWIVVVNSPYDEVTAVTKKDLHQHLILLSIVVLFFIIGSAFVTHDHRLKIRAEGETRHWREKKDLGDQIRQSEERYRTMVETAHDMIWILNSQGDFTFINKSIKEMLGYEESEIIGKKFWYLLQLMELPNFNDRFLKTLQGESQNYEMRFLAKDNRIRTLLVTSIPFHEKDKIAGVLSFGRDITESREAEKALRASENKCRILVDYLPQKIFLKDRGSVYTYCNDNFAQDFNISPDQITGKADYDLYPRELAEKQIAEDHKVMKSGKPLDIEENYVKDGHNAIVRRFKMPTRDERGSITGILGISWDVTEKVRLESIAEAVNTLNNIGYVFSGIRHEIGNPISTAKMVLSVLKKQVNVFSKEAIADYIDRAMGEIHRVEYLLQALKNFNMYEILEPQKVEIRSFLDKFLSMVANDFVKKGILIESTIHPDVETAYIDPRALQQVMLNVMSNASDALKERNDPKITISVSKKRDTVEIKTFDNGCGMSEEQQKELFKPFRTTKPNGTGLGLVIARKMLLGMKGTIEIRSRKDEGTTIEIAIPERKDDINGSS